ncbi:MAG TPA: class I SAM-dependent methyltransferase, partial [Afifellaceae bacterium]|nr:class I SAM-dependent methyltransferase [Afifellaceae bacterium]
MSSEKAPTAATQRWSPDTYDDNVRFVTDLGAGVLEWLDPKPGERILDLGCGDGVLTVKLIESGADVVGADASEDFIQAARERGIDARLIDGHTLTFEKEFDAVFSNAALHWMTQPEKVIAGVARALKPGGRFVAEF